MRCCDRLNPQELKVEWLSNAGKTLLWSYAPNGHIGAFVIVDVHPACSIVLHLLNACPLVLTQPLIAHRSIEPLDIGILLRVAWLDV